MNCSTGLRCSLAFCAGLALGGWILPRSRGADASSGRAEEALHASIRTEAHRVAEVPDRRPAAMAERLEIADAGTPFAQARYLLAVVEHATLDDLDRLLAMIEDVDDARLKELQFELVLRRWAQLDPESACVYVETGRSPAKPQRLATVFEIWASQSPRRAWKALAQLDGERLQAAALDGMARGWASARPEIMAAFFATLAPRDYDAAVVRLASGIAERHPRAAATWAMTIADDRRRIRALSDITARWVHDEPAAAMQWMLESNWHPRWDEHP